MKVHKKAILQASPSFAKGRWGRVFSTQLLFKRNGEAKNGIAIVIMTTASRQRLREVRAFNKNKENKMILAKIRIKIAK